jgi:hypothetical protein
VIARLAVRFERAGLFLFVLGKISSAMASMTLKRSWLGCEETAAAGAGVNKRKDPKLAEIETDTSEKD